MKKLLLAGAVFLLTSSTALAMDDGWKFDTQKKENSASCVLLDKLPDGRIFNIIQIVSGAGNIDNMIMLADPGVDFKKNKHAFPVEISFDSGEKKELWFHLMSHGSAASLTPDEINWIKSGMLITGKKMSILMDYDKEWEIDLPFVWTPAVHDYQACVSAIDLLAWKLKH